ncbi:hypothetical protein GF352_04280, partial [archaeon]|nr:hypothetical protein [archaeon]
MKWELNKEPVARLGSLEIKLPVLELGAGKPVLTVITGVHGDETTGLFVLKELRDKVKEVRGVLRLIPSANPLAQSLKTRRAPTDYQDLNRSYPVKSNLLTDKAAEVLASVTRDSDFLIDIHTSKLETPLMGVLFTHSHTNSVSEEMLRVFSPKQVWVIDPVKEVKYKGCLSSYLNELGVPNMGLEINHEESFNSKEVADCVEGVERVMKRLGLLKGGFNKGKPPFYHKNSYKSDNSGLFKPLKKPFEKVKKGDLVGLLYELPGFKKSRVSAHDDGVL